MNDFQKNMYFKCLNDIARSKTIKLNLIANVSFESAPEVIKNSLRAYLSKTQFCLQAALKHTSNALCIYASRFFLGAALMVPQIDITQTTPAFLRNERDALKRPPVWRATSHSFSALACNVSIPFYSKKMVHACNE